MLKVANVTSYPPHLLVFLYLFLDSCLIASSVAALRRERRDCKTNASPRRPEWGKAKQKAERTFRSPKEGGSGRETQRSEKSGLTKSLVEIAFSRAADKHVVSDSDWDGSHLEAENENMANSGSYRIPLSWLQLKPSRVGEHCPDMQATLFILLCLWR